MEKRMMLSINPKPHHSPEIKIVFALVAGLISISLPSFASKGPPDFEQLLKNGYNNLAQGRTNEALEMFQNKTAKYPDSPVCHTAVGRALKRLGKFSEAKVEFRKATECDAGYADAFYELGSVLESDKEWDGAARAFQRYLELKPDSALRQTVDDRIKYCQAMKSG